MQQRNRSTDVRLLRIQGAADCENEEYRIQRMAFERLGEGRMATEAAHVAGADGLSERRYRVVAIEDNSTLILIDVLCVFCYG